MLTKHLRAETALPSRLQAFETTSTSCRKSSVKNGKFHLRPTRTLSTLCRRSSMRKILALDEVVTVLAWGASKASRRYVLSFIPVVFQHCSSYAFSFVYFPDFDQAEYFRIPPRGFRLSTSVHCTRRGASPLVLLLHHCYCQAAFSTRLSSYSTLIRPFCRGLRSTGTRSARCSLRDGGQASTASPVTPIHSERR